MNNLEEKFDIMLQKQEKMEKDMYEILNILMETKKEQTKIKSNVRKVNLNQVIIQENISDLKDRQFDIKADILALKIRIR